MTRVNQVYWLKKQGIPTGLLPAINGIETRNRALDLGCGGGRVAAELTSTYSSVCGIDLDRSLILKAANKHPRIQFICGDFSDAHVWESLGYFDLIVCNCAIRKDYCPDLRLLSRHCLRHGGTIAFRIQGVNDMKTVLPESLRQQTFYNEEELREAFADLPGLTITEEKFQQQFSSRAYFSVFLDKINVTFQGQIDDLRPVRHYYILSGSG